MFVLFTENPHVPRVVLCLAASFLVFNGLFQRYLPTARHLPVIHHPGGRNLLHIEVFHVSLLPITSNYPFSFFNKCRNLNLTSTSDFRMDFYMLI